MLNKNINLHLYTLTQEKLQIYIKDQLKEKEIPFTYLDGNIFSIRFPDQPLWLAHLDMISEESTKSSLVIRKNRISRKHGTLGADDRAGVNILLNHIDEINFCFTRDEELAGQGIEVLMSEPSFTDQLKSLPCGLEFDRRNRSDIIAYCQDDLIDAIQGVNPTYKPAQGIYSDVTTISSILPSANLSCGYYKPHTNKEFLDIPDYLFANAQLRPLNSLKGPFTKNPRQSLLNCYSEVRKINYSNFLNANPCSLCSAPPTTEITPDMFLCSTCIEDLIYRLTY